MRHTYAQAGQAAWAHILPTATLVSLLPSERWRPGAGADVRVAEYAGQVVGFVCARPSADADANPTIAEIDALYVHPDLWGTGVGRALLAEATVYLAESGFAEVTLWTEHRNYRPLRFYRAAGWRLDGAERRRDFRGTELIEQRHRRRLE
jgi:GNAT superfamily N-acetyltransferase